MTRKFQIMCLHTNIICGVFRGHLACPHLSCNNLSIQLLRGHNLYFILKSHKFVKEMRIAPGTKKSRVCARLTKNNMKWRL